jgi:cytochrome c556
MRRLLIVGAGLLVAQTAAAMVMLPEDHAPGAKGGAARPVAAVEHRQAQMKQLGRSMKLLGAFAKGEVADAAQARQAGATLAQASRAMPALWPAGTWVGVGDSAAKASIWTEKAEFAARVAQFQTAAAAMNVAAASGDKAEVGRRLGPLGASCKACHTAYQAED